jgi:hypothetical protein
MELLACHSPHCINFLKTPESKSSGVCTFCRMYGHAQPVRSEYPETAVTKGYQDNIERRNVRTDRGMMEDVCGYSSFLR